LLIVQTRDGELRFQLFGKKRGDRRTGSRIAGSMGEAVFFGILFLLGITSLSALVTSQVLNPNPEIYRIFVGFWLVVLVLASLMLIGGVGLVYSVVHAGASAERRSAMVRQAAAINLIREALPSPQEYPNVPHDERLTDSPGVSLAYRLPSEMQRTVWKMATMAILALLLSGFASVLGVLFLAGWLIVRPNWILLGFTVPFLGFGVWSIWRLLADIWRFGPMGPTYIEISDFPLHPGKEYEIAVSQSGRFSLNSLQLSLVCEEEATYYQGTDVRMETKVVSKQQILRREQLELEARSPFVARAVLAVPPNAVHSFQSAHNAVRWKLLVEGEPITCPAFARNFPVIIYPNRNGTHTTAED
jgi:hypothetical protein